MLRDPVRDEGPLSDANSAEEVMATQFEWEVVCEEWCVPIDSSSGNVRLPPLHHVVSAAKVREDPKADWKVYKYTIINTYGNSFFHIFLVLD